MKPVSLRSIGGVTLIELMIAVVIVGILAAFAYPAYTDHMRQARRTDAQTALLRAAAAQEKFFADCSTYASSFAGASADCATGQLGFGAATPTSAEGHYSLTLSAGAVNTAVCNNDFDCGFTVTANPVAGGPQVNNGALRIDSTGVRQWNRNGAGTWVAWTAK